MEEGEIGSSLCVQKTRLLQELHPFYSYYKVVIRFAISAKEV